MNETGHNPQRAESDEPGQSGSDDSGSSASRSGKSFLGRLASVFRPINTVSLRENIADALQVDSETNMAFSPGERAMLHNILLFREVRVDDVMVPRADIEAVEQSITIGELMVLFEESGRSRMPVYSETLDDPRGMVHIRDLLSWVMKQARPRRRSTRANAASASTNGNSTARADKKTPAKSAGFDLSRVDLSKTLSETNIVRQLLFVPPSMHAADLLARMQTMRLQMALVIDEYGGTDGLVSLEDIVEMVVGDIEDEHDDEEIMFKKTAEDIFVADAKVELEELAAAIGPDFDIKAQLEDVDTLGGLIFSSLGRIPVRGELVQALPGFEFQILDADPRRVKRVRITRRRIAHRRRTKNEMESAPMATQNGSDPQNMSDDAEK